MGRLATFLAAAALLWGCTQDSPSPAPASSSRSARPPARATRQPSIEHAETPLRVDGDVVAPVVVKRVDPDWSKLPQHFQYKGIVLLEAVIDENGIPTSVRALKGQPELTEPSIAALKQWRFKPGTLHGNPVPVIFNLTVNPHFR
jgi:hypothetical protein